MAGFKNAPARAPRPIDLKASGAAGSIDAALQAVTSVLNAHDDEIKKLNGGITLGQNTVGILKTLSFKMPDDPPWKRLTSGANWDSTCDYLIEPGGLVRLRGSFAPKAGKIAPVAAGTGTSILATMPANYWPVQAAVFPGKSGDTGSQVPALFSLTAAGVLAYVGGTATADLVGVDGLQWYATAAAAPHQFDEPNWPLRVKHGFDDRCRGVAVLGYRLQGQKGQNVGGGTPHVDWQDLGDGSLRINGVWGLQWSSRYDLTLYLTPEEAT